MVDYEWKVEYYNEDDDIFDSFAGVWLAELMQIAPGYNPEAVREELVLVRTTEDGDRSWAYVRENALPEFFEIPSGNGLEYVPTSTTVPKRFHNELRAYIAKHGPHPMMAIWKE